MAGLTQTEQQATLDARFPTTGGTDYSANGTSETASLARTAIGATTPTWLTVALSVLPFVGAGIGYTAQANTPGYTGEHEA